MKLHPARRSVAVTWDPLRKQPDLLHRALDALSDVPGVQVGTGRVVLPYNTWSLPDAETLLCEAEGQIPWPGGDLRAARVAREHPAWGSLFSHQAEGVQFHVEHGGGLLADEMGAGKTRTAAFAAFALAESSPKVIVAPLYTRESWRRELLALGFLRRPDDLVCLEGREPALSAIPKGTQWIWVHYDVLHAWSTFIQARGSAGVFVIDEAHTIKNSRTKRGKGINVALQAAHRILLTGTPVLNRPSELWYLLTLVDGPGSWGSPTDFRVRYCGATHNGFGYEDHGTTCNEELQQRLRFVYLRRTSEDVDAPLPPLRNEPVWAELDDEDAHAYRDETRSHDMRKLLEALETGSLRDDVLQGLNRLRALTSDAKLPTTMSYILGRLEEGQDILVFTWRRKTAQQIAAGIERRAVTKRVRLLLGGNNKRDDIVDAFQEKGGVLVATLDALKEGVTLHRANVVVMHDLDYVPAKMLQGIKRIHRIGQARACVAAWVMGRGTIDKHVARLVLRKAKDQKDMLGILAAQKVADELGLGELGGREMEVDNFLQEMDEWLEK